MRSAEHFKCDAMINMMVSCSASGRLHPAHHGTGPFTPCSRRLCSCLVLVISYTSHWPPAQHSHEKSYPRDNLLHNHITLTRPTSTDPEDALKSQDSPPSNPCRSCTQRKHQVTNPNPQVPGPGLPGGQWSTLNGFSTELGPGLVGLYRQGGGKSTLLTADMEAVAGLTDFALTN